MAVFFLFKVAAPEDFPIFKRKDTCFTPNGNRIRNGQIALLSSEFLKRNKAKTNERNVSKDPFILIRDVFFDLTSRPKKANEIRWNQIVLRRKI